MKIDPSELVREAEKPLRELVKKIREENVGEALREAQQSVAAIIEHTKKNMLDVLNRAQHNVEFISRATCRNLLYLGCGIAGLSILTTTVLIPIIKQLRSNSTDTENNPPTRIDIASSIGRYALSFSSGIALLATGYFGLR